MSTNSPYLVCFGDSLTAGYQPGVGGFGLNANTPPGGFIQEWIGSQIRIAVTAICGETTEEMVKRFHQDVVELRPNMVVILGGTNDLGCQVSPLEISKNLQSIYSSAFYAGIQPVGVTVPSICIGNEGKVDLAIPIWLRTHIEQRIILNQKILEICEKLNMQCLDLFHETAEGSVRLLADQYSSDGLHFNTAGYKAFARLICRKALADTFGYDWFEA